MSLDSPDSPPFESPKPQAKKAGGRRGRRRDTPNCEPVSSEKHRETLREILLLWLQTDENRLLKDIRTNKEIVAKLDAESRYNSEAENSVRVSEGDLHLVRKMALDEIGVTILLGKGKDAYLGPFEERKNKLQQAHGLKVLHVPAPRNGIPASASAFYTEAGFCFTQVIETCGQELQTAPSSPPPAGKKTRTWAAADESSEAALPRVALGGGKTLFDMIDYLPQTKQKFHLQALNYATRLSDSDMYDSTNLALIAHRLFRWDSTVHVMNLPPLHKKNPKAAAEWHNRLYHLNSDIRDHFQGSLDPDIVFVGTGNFYRGSPSISRFYNNLGIDYATLEEYRPVGDINLCFFDANGHDLTPQILENHLGKTAPALAKKLYNGSFFKKEPFSHPFLLGLNIQRLKQLVRDGKRVIVVAAGPEKVAAIDTLLEKKIINGLVTDEDTMDRLIETWESRQKPGR